MDGSQVIKRIVIIVFFVAAVSACKMPVSHVPLFVRHDMTQEQDSMPADKRIAETETDSLVSVSAETIEIEADTIADADVATKGKTEKSQDTSEISDRQLIRDLVKTQNEFIRALKEHIENTSVQEAGETDTLYIDRPVEKSTPDSAGESGGEEPADKSEPIDDKRDGLVREKEDIIREKDELIREKDEVIREKNDMIANLQNENDDLQETLQAVGGLKNLERPEDAPADTVYIAREKQMESDSMAEVTAVLEEKDKQIQSLRSMLIKVKSEKDTVFIREDSDAPRLLSAKSDSLENLPAKEDSATSKNILAADSISDTIPGDDVKRELVKISEDSLKKLDTRVDSLQKQLRTTPDTLVKHQTVHDTITVKEETVRTPDTILIVFYYPRGTVSPKDEDSLLVGLKRHLSEKDIESVLLSGYTDQSGSTEYNRILAGKRLTYLEEKIGKYISSRYIFRQNFSDTLASETPVEGERRTEVRLILEADAEQDK
ncbi:MAG: hypothetical protein ACQES0_10010 [Bacteroidota bacterium]